MSIFKPTEFIKKICKIPIDPEKMRGEYNFSEDESWEDCQLIQTNSNRAPADCFVFWRELMKTICEGTKWNKKARIIIEYDPGQDKFAVSTFMDKHEADVPEIPSK